MLKKQKQKQNKNKTKNIGICIILTFGKSSQNMDDGNQGLEMWSYV